MLQPTEAFDEDTRLTMVLRRQIAFDPETHAYLIRSAGRSASGRLARYTVIFPTSGSGQVLRLTAASDAEALVRAQARMAQATGEGGRRDG